MRRKVIRFMLDPVIAVPFALTLTALGYLLVAVWLSAQWIVRRIRGLKR